MLKVYKQLSIFLANVPGTLAKVLKVLAKERINIFGLMVTEPTPFGLHDLEVATEVVKQLGVPMGVVVNFAGIGDKGVYEFCEQQGIPVLMEIPFDRRIAELYSQGVPFTEEMTEWRQRFRVLLEAMEGLAK